MSLLDSLLLEGARLEVWIAQRPDGVGGSGTETDPYNGGTATNFDALMNSFPANTTIHLGPGLFETRGHSERGPSSWLVKAGQKIIGSGMYQTTLKIVEATVPNALYWAVACQIFPIQTVDYFEASDFTIDCNLGGQPIPVGKSFSQVACGAIAVRGSHIRIRRVRAINFGTQGFGSTLQNPECFVVFVGLPFPSSVEAVDCAIEECLVEKPSENNTRESTCLFIAGGGNGAVTAYHRGCAIRNCMVDCRYSNGAPSHSIPIIQFTPLAGPTGLKWRIKTNSSHNRTIANNVTISGVGVFPFVGTIPFPSTVFNGSFPIDSIDSNTELSFTLASTPDGTSPGGAAPMIGVNFNALGAAVGTAAVIEGNRVYGATTAEYNDTGSSRDFVVRNNYFTDVICGVCHSLGLSGETSPISSLTANGAIATLTTSVAHGLLPRSAVRISNVFVNARLTNPFNRPLKNGVIFA